MSRATHSGSSITIVVNGSEEVVPAGCSVAAALLLCGVDESRRTSVGDEPRGVFCGMGSCFDCVVTIDGQPTRRTCITEAVEGMQIVTRPVGGVR